MHALSSPSRIIFAWVRGKSGYRSIAATPFLAFANQLCGNFLIDCTLGAAKSDFFALSPKQKKPLGIKVNINHSSDRILLFILAKMFRFLSTKKLVAKQRQYCGVD